jgi:hypothetical protein
MKHIADIQPGGFLVDNEYHKEVGAMIAQRDQLIYALTGDKCIISGVVNTSGTTYSEGYITFNNKVYRFLGGAFNTNVSIQRIEHERTNASQVLAPAFYEDVIAFGNDGDNTFPFSDLKRIDNLHSLILAEESEVDNDELDKIVTLMNLLKRTPSTQKRALIRLATATETLAGEKTDVAISPKELIALVLRNPTTAIRSMLRFATATELAQRQLNNVALSPSHIDSFDSILFTGKVSSNGVKQSFTKKDFQVSRTGTGQYLITHNLGNSSYGVSGAGISSDGNIKLAIGNISANNFEVGLSDDLSRNDTDFVFQVFKV